MLYFEVSQWRKNKHIKQQLMPKVYEGTSQVDFFKP